MEEASTSGPIGDTYSKRSCDLYHILDLLGVSEDVRRIFVESNIRADILYTVVENPPFIENLLSVYHMGSYGEGTYVPFLSSDFDIIKCDERYPVVETLKDAPQTGDSLLLVAKDDTRPGYVQLQLLDNGKTLEINDRTHKPDCLEMDDLGRVFMKARSIEIEGANHTRNGPADTVIMGPCHMDIVLAYRCKTIPKAYGSWFHNSERRWPSEAQIRRFESFGCLFVGVGHPKSRNQSIEWRVSFSLQERELMWSLNPTQNKCYILLKMIRVDIILPKVGEETISSYHCKTCLFHTIEKSPQFEWSPGNLIKGIRLCLETILNCAMEGNCPNFFIPASNLFDKMDQNTLRKVTEVIQNLLSEWAKVISYIEQTLHGIPNVYWGSTRRMLLDFIPLITYKDAMDVLYARKYVLRNICLSNSQETCYFGAKFILDHLNATADVTEHDPRDVRMTLNSLVPHVHLQIAQCIASSNLEMIDDIYPIFMSHLQEGQKCDAISSQLVLASFYLRQKRFQACEDVLKACSVALARSTVTSLCFCTMNRIGKESDIASKVMKNKEQLIDIQFACCLVFLPFQFPLVHPALRYEIYRSVCTHSESENDLMRFGRDWIGVDSKVYLCFLQYIVYSKLNKMTFKTRAVRNLQVICNDVCISHRATAFNLLGWIHIQENKMEEAWRCFWQSWKIEPFHNAAKWHIAVMVHTLLQDK